MVSYVMTARRVSKGAFMPEPGSLKYLKLPDGAAEPTPDHAVPLKGWFNDLALEANGRPNPRSISPCGDVLVHVHGYNVNPAAALKAQRQLQKGLEAEGWRGVVVGFDWPSDEAVLNYLEDRADGAEVARLLVTGGIRPLSTMQVGGCRANVHFIAHSAGAYVTMEAFVQAEKLGGLFKSDWRIGQAAFIAADVSADSLAEGSDWADPMFRRVMRLTNYQNPFDNVLAVSNAKRLGVSPRAGRVGLSAPVRRKAANVDCGGHFQTLKPGAKHKGINFPHSWHIYDPVFCRDLAMTLEGAIDREAIPTRGHDRGRLVLQDGARPPHQDAWGDLSEPLIS